MNCLVCGNSLQGNRQIKFCNEFCYHNNSWTNISLAFNDRECKNCNRQFTRNFGKQIFCDKSCHDDYNKMQVLNCVVCRQKFQLNTGLKKTCSKHCFDLMRKKNRKNILNLKQKQSAICQYCFQEFLFVHRADREIRKFCSRSCNSKWHVKNGKFQTWLEAGKYSANATSKFENEVYQFACQKFPKLNFEQHYELVIDDKSYYPDIFCSKFNFIIEINGDFWHCNPSHYSSDFVRYGKSALDVWNSDKDRLIAFSKRKISTKIIWEKATNWQQELCKFIKRCHYENSFV